MEHAFVLSCLQPDERERVEQIRTRKEDDEQIHRNEEEERNNRERREQAAESNRKAKAWKAEQDRKFQAEIRDSVRQMGKKEYALPTGREYWAAHGDQFDNARLGRDD
jgi:hypothetical protein